MIIVSTRNGSEIIRFFDFSPPERLVKATGKPFTVSFVGYTSTLKIKKERMQRTISKQKSKIISSSSERFLIFDKKKMTSL